MKKKTKAMRQGTLIRWDAVDFVKTHKKPNKPASLFSAEEARKMMMERHSKPNNGIFEEVKEPVTAEAAYSYMTQDAGADDARNRMIERQTKQRLL